MTRPQPSATQGCMILLDVISSLSELEPAADIEFATAHLERSVELLRALHDEPRAESRNRMRRAIQHVADALERLQQTGPSASLDTSLESLACALAVLHPTARAAMSAVNLQACRPVLPVKALALPELTTSARGFAPLRWSRHHSTGADGHFDWVNTPAMTLPSSSSASSTSVRPAYLMPAAAVASLTPAIAGMSGTLVGARGETAMERTVSRE